MMQWIGEVAVTQRSDRRQLVERECRHAMIEAVPFRESKLIPLVRDSQNS